MRVLMGVIKDRHVTYYARQKVPERLQTAVARILDNGKDKQVWLRCYASRLRLRFVGRLRWCVGCDRVSPRKSATVSLTTL
ncbi:MAG: hypothetical protein WAU57_03190 [Xanthobacteraceae bacterium]